ncbi:MAG: ribonuclease III [Desulfovibrionaceae bacterium]|nr:ribonuclease III [Desulfovibrionaceae bacterium]
MTNSSSNDCCRETQLRHLETALDHVFKDRQLLEQALTHSSYANECGNVEHNERLEFLGDAVLELCVSGMLYAKFPITREGGLTRIRSSIVDAETLAGIARQIGLQHLLILGHGEEIQGGRERESLLSDALEAVLAAIYLDGGFYEAKKTVEQLFAQKFEESFLFLQNADPIALDCKTRLQEIVQHSFKAMPIYTLISTKGPDHAKTFAINLTLPNGKVFTGYGSSRKRAEQEAAKIAIKSLSQST